MANEISETEPQKLSPEEAQAEAEEYHRYVGMFLRSERERLGLGVEDAAKLAGRSKGWVSQVERGQNDSAKAAKLLAIVLDVDFAYIAALAENAVATQKKQGLLSRSSK